VTLTFDLRPQTVKLSSLSHRTSLMQFWWKCVKYCARYRVNNVWDAHTDVPTHARTNRIKAVCLRPHYVGRRHKNTERQPTIISNEIWKHEREHASGKRICRQRDGNRKRIPGSDTLISPFCGGPGGDVKFSRSTWSRGQILRSRFRSRPRFVGLVLVLGLMTLFSFSYILASWPQRRTSL